MKIIKPSAEIVRCPSGEEVLAFIEECGRTCYKSEDKITADSSKKFVANLIERGHDSVLEHCSATVRFICDRGVSHEIVRHRLASYSQESTRYCAYDQDKFGHEITVIEPSFFEPGTEEYWVWKAACLYAEAAYFTLLDIGASAQEARSVLPNSLKTEVVMTANMREWRRFFDLRCAKAAHPQMRELALPLLREFNERIHVLFDDLAKKYLDEEKEFEFTCEPAGFWRTFETPLGQAPKTWTLAFTTEEEAEHESK